MKKLAIICFLIVSVFAMSFTVSKFGACQAHLWTGIVCFNPTVGTDNYCSSHSSYPPPTPAPSTTECTKWVTARIKCGNDAVPGTSFCEYHTVPPLALVDSTSSK